MENNKIILRFIKDHLHKDLNDDFNELGCAQTVNNVLKLSLGYVAGGGASTRAMLDTIVNNANFKEVTRFEAIAGDIILSATGTGNGVIAHGHVGFLGDNGLIYSNNSMKNMLDDHLTAEQWKNYFTLKGGFPVRYFRAVGTPLINYIPKETESNIPKVLQSSQNPNNISLTVKFLVPMIVSWLATQNIIVQEQDVLNITTQLTMVVTGIGALYGIVRKYK